MNKYAVIGNPIKHSCSPFIHRSFAKQTKIKMQYEAQLVPLNQFNYFIDGFHTDGGKGVNVTAPFKEQAFHYCDQLTEKAQIAGAVNTIKWRREGGSVGDNTDGIGLVSDLRRIDFLFPKCRILLIGAGGAARGVIFPLLQQDCQLVVMNRTFSKAQQLAHDFKQYGNISAIEQPTFPFDLIINATSSGIQGGVPVLPDGIFSQNTACYDMFYHATLTPFLSWAVSKQCERYADGLGMLVAQAAYSFYVWHDIMPEYQSVLKALRTHLTEKEKDEYNSY